MQFSSLEFYGYLFKPYDLTFTVYYRKSKKKCQYLIQLYYQYNRETFPFVMHPENSFGSKNKGTIFSLIK